MHYQHKHDQPQKYLVIAKFATTAADEENQVSKTPPAYRMSITRYTGGVYLGVLYSFSGFTQLLNEVRK